MLVLVLVLVIVIVIVIVIEGDAVEYEYEHERRSAEHQQEWFSSGRNTQGGWRTEHDYDALCFLLLAPVENYGQIVTRTIAPRLNARLPPHLHFAS